VHNNDSFIDEVTEEVRRDRLFALMRKYGWIGIALVLVIVGGAAFNEWRKLRAETAARAFGDAVLAAMANDAPEARLKALEGIEAQGPRQAVRDLLASAEALAAKDRAVALDRLAAIAADASLPDSYRQLAQLKSVLIAGDKMAPADRDAALAALARPGAPYRPLAMELQAHALADAGKTGEAVALLQQILQEAGATQGLQARVQQMIVSLGGVPAAG
jgi:hypothetical protein